MLLNLVRTLGTARLPSVVFVLGGPGAGKGTQCMRIVQVLHRGRCGVIY